LGFTTFNRGVFREGLFGKRKALRETFPVVLHNLFFEGLWLKARSAGGGKDFPSLQRWEGISLGLGHSTTLGQGFFPKGVPQGFVGDTGFGKFSPEVLHEWEFLPLTKADEISAVKKGELGQKGSFFFWV